MEPDNVEESLPNRTSIDRRTALKGAAGLGLVALSALGSNPAAAKAGAAARPKGNAHIDPYFGYASPGGQDFSKAGIDLRPDRTVELHIEEGPIGFHFAPMGLQIAVGDTVEFHAPTPDHTVTAYHVGHGRQQRVPDDAKPFSSPVLPIGASWLYRFDHPGTYDIYCAPHALFGMVLRLVVGDPDDDAYDGEFGSTGRPPISAADIEAIPGVTSWPFPTPAEIFATNALSVDNIVTNGPVTRTDVLIELGLAGP